MKKMSLGNTVLLLFMYYTLHFVQGVSDPRFIISEVIDKFCPSAGVCRRSNDTSTVGPFPTGLTSCCTECSCDEDCNLQNNCCFPVKSQNNIPNRTNQQCTFFTTKPLAENEKRRYRSYYTVTEGPTEGCYLDSENSATHNGNALGDTHTEAPWGQLFPVYSRATGKIYKNQSLAECYGENDTLHWTTVLVCNKFYEAKDVVIGLTAHAEALVGDSSSSHCHVSFVYPGDKADIKPHICFSDVIETCNNLSFTVPEGYELTHEHIRALCTSGFLSPYFQDASYANVFCHICNGNSFRATSLCTKPSEFLRGTDNFVTILRGDFTLFYKKQSSPKTNVNGKLVCKNPTALPETCRNILCPSGQLRAVNGSCIWPFIDVDMSATTLILVLTPVQPFPSYLISRLSNPITSRNYPEWISSPWPNTWRTGSIFYDITSDDIPVVKYFIVHQEVFNNETSVTARLEEIEKYMKNRWTALIRNTSFELTQSFSSSTGSPEDFPAFFEKTRTKWSRVRLLGLYLAPEVYSRTLFVTKMFFCDQIELEKNEYSFDASGQVLIYNKTKQVFLDAEFTITSNIYGNPTVRMCLEDTEFTFFMSRGYNLTSNGSLMFVLLLMIDYCLHNGLF